MAETYLTPTFQNATKPQVAAPQAAAPQTGASPPAPVSTPQTGGETYQTPTFKQAVAPPQTTGGNANAGQPSGWGVKGWGPGLLPQPGFGDVTMPQSAQDFGNVAGNEAMMGTIPGLRAQAEAARQRLGPASAGADLVGNIASPTTLLNFFGGPELAGAAHEGIKSAVANWTPDQSWPTYLKNVTEDAAGGAAWGGLGRGAAAAAPAVGQFGARVGVQGGIPTVAGIVGHTMFGHGDVYKELAHMAPEFASMFALDETAKNAGVAAKNALASPVAQQAIKSLVLGGGSTARNYAGPYDQWGQ